MHNSIFRLSRGVICWRQYKNKSKKLTPVLTTVIQFFFAKGNAQFWPNLSVSIRGLTNGWTDGWESVRIDR